MKSETPFPADELRRYSRQILLPEIGTDGQSRLREARVLVVGAGGLGSPASQYLAAAGVGELTLVEFDEVEESNLHRQLLFTPADVGRSKSQVAAERLRALAPQLELNVVDQALDAENACELVRGHDLVVDGTDNFPARYAVNDACVLERVPNVYGAVLRFEGQVSVFAQPGGPCYRCLFPEVPQAGSVPNCAEAGVLGVLPGVIGTLQATEALKLLLGLGEALMGRMLTYDAIRGRFAEVRLLRDPSCPVCGDEPTIREVANVALACDRSPTAFDPSANPHEITVEELQARMEAGTAPVILDVRLEEEVAMARIAWTSIHVPLHLLPMRLEELDPSREYAVLCHLGVRSRDAVRFLVQHGFESPRDVLGGIDRWSSQIDASVPRY